MKKEVLNCKICDIKINKDNSLKGTFLSRHAYYRRCVKCIKIFNDERYKKRNIKSSVQASKKYRFKNWAKFLIYSASRNRSKKIKKVTIDKDWVLNQFKKQNKKCFWTGVDLHLTTSDHPLKPSLDRLIVDGNYSPENTVISCKAVNFGRNENNLDDFKNFLKAVVKSN